MSDFSVLISVYYKEKALFLKEALDSIWSNQLLKPKQIVLVEDGPLTPDLYEVIHNFQEQAGDVLTLVRNETNQGLAKALNRGIKVVTTELIARMDSDDISDEKRFLYEIEYMDKHPDIMILGGSIQEMDETGRMLGKRFYPESHEKILQHIWKGTPLAHPTVIMRKSVFENIHYNEDVGQNEDIALWFDALRNEIKMANLNTIVYFFRMSPNLYSRRGRRKAWNELKIYSKGLWSLFGFSYKYIYPFLRFLFRLCSPCIVKYCYNSNIRRKILES